MAQTSLSFISLILEQLPRIKWNNIRNTQISVKTALRMTSATKLDYDIIANITDHPHTNIVGVFCDAGQDGMKLLHRIVTLANYIKAVT